jgi:diguanylate cyclase (GGDEF)-like protein
MLTNNGYEVRQLLNGKQALQVVNYDPPELIILDIMMPELNGYEVCQQLKANPKTSKIPVIFLSARGHFIDKVKAFQVGGIDYITKPFFLAEVLCRVQTHLAISRYQRALEKEIAAKEKAQKELFAANRELERIANLDGLTGIANRRRFNEYLAQEWGRASRERQVISLLVIDIDYFKLYNDNYGHLAGDNCLKYIAKGIEKVLKRPTDLAARYGGEEFAVILPHTRQEGAELVAIGIQGEIRTMAIPHAGSTVADYVTLSIGVASMIPSPQLSSHLLINMADEALYQAKKAGRNRIISRACCA